MSETLCKIFVPYGALGTGISEASFQNGVRLGPDAIVCDAGSTDSGPYYLGTGKCKYARDALKEDFARMIKAGHALRVPVMIGSAGTCGTDKGVDDMFDIAKEICAEEGIHARIALIYCSQSAAVLKQKYSLGKVKPLSGAPEIDETVFDACENIVGLAGAKPFIQALEDGADVVICGRATDTAILAAVPLMKGCAEGACWHAAKTAECGSICTTNPSGGGVFLTFDRDGFTIEPTSDDSRCTPYTVSAHMIYENANPYLLHFPVQLDAQLPSFALLFSPAEIEKGAVYEFRLHHAADVDDEMELFTLRMEIV